MSTEFFHQFSSVKLASGEYLAINLIQWLIVYGDAGILGVMVGIGVDVGVGMTPDRRYTGPHRTCR